MKSKTNFIIIAFITLITFFIVFSIIINNKKNHLPGKTAVSSKISTQKEFKEIENKDSYKTIKVGDHPNKIIKILGNPVLIKDMGKDGFIEQLSGIQANDKKYVYKNAVFLVTERDDNLKFIKSIKIKDSSYETERGLHIGDNLQRVFSLYGKAEYADGTIDYQNYDDRFGMYLVISNNKVEAITLYTFYD